MSQYVDGFVIPLRKDKIDTYRQLAEEAGQIWMEHGALEFRECIGDDLQVQDMVSFPQLAGTTPEETVVFSWIVYQSREHRDEVNTKVMADPRMLEIMARGPGPFDCTRMAYGGFKPLVQL